MNPQTGDDSEAEPKDGDGYVYLESVGQIP